MSAFAAFPPCVSDARPGYLGGVESILRIVPLRLEFRKDGGETIVWSRTMPGTGRATDMSRSSVLDRRHEAFVATRAPPPDSFLRAGSEVRGRERPVLLGVPLSQQIWPLRRKAILNRGHRHLRKHLPISLLATEAYLTRLDQAGPRSAVACNCRQKRHEAPDGLSMGIAFGEADVTWRQRSQGALTETNDPIACFF